MENTTIISAADKDFLNGTAGFIARYIQNRAYYATCREAYEVTEQQYQAIMGRPRYSGYRSFTSACTKYYAKRKKRSERD